MRDYLVTTEILGYELKERYMCDEMELAQLLYDSENCDEDVMPYDTIRVYRVTDDLKLVEVEAELLYDEHDSMCRIEIDGKKFDLMGEPGKWTVCMP